MKAFIFQMWANTPFCRHKTVADSKF